MPPEVVKDNITWEDIPESEKASQEEIEALDARSAGEWDGFNHELNKRVRQAATSGNPTENLRKLREDLKIPGPVYGVDVNAFIESNREILFSRVEKNLLAAAYEAVVIMGLEKANALFLNAVEKAVEDRKCLK